MSDILHYAFNHICQHADQAHYIFFGLLVLAGFNVPISEDLLLLTAGALVSRCIPDQYWHLYFWMYFGCWITGWIPYWIGRLLGPKLYKIRWFNHILNPKRIENLHFYYEKFGVWTFIVGRLIPGGVRNALFITSGMGKMPFLVFVIRDFIAAFISTNIVFYIGYTFGQNYELIAHYVIRYNKIAFLILILLCLLAIIRIWWKNRNKESIND